MRRPTFKGCESFQDVLYRRDYAERLVASFSNQIQSEYCGGNISVSIEGIALEHFSAVTQTNLNSTTPSRQRHAVFQYFYLMIANIMLPLIMHTANAWFLFSKRKKLMTTSLSKIWENTDGCAEQYRCSSALYLMSVISQCYSIIIYWVISAPGHGKEVLDELNDVDKR